jgi:hypothetical protein
VRASGYGLYTNDTSIPAATLDRPTGPTEGNDHEDPTCRPGAECSINWKRSRFHHGTHSDSGW